MLFKSIVSAALVASSLAQPIAHQHHQHEKKAVVTNYNTVYVTVGADGAATTTTSAVATEAAESSTKTSASAASAASSSSSSSSTSSGSFDGPAKGISYSPYSDDGGCKSASTIKSEVEALSAYEVIRIYGVDCNQVEYTLAGMADGQKLFAGIYDMTAIESAVSTIAAAVEEYGGWDVIHTVSVGNELVNGGEATTSQIKSYVSTARSALKAKGYTGSVVSVDTFIAVINNPALCDYSDYIAVNAHPYFDGGVTAAESGEWVLEQIERVASTCGSSKSVLITETGWPTKGDTYGSAVPSKANQKTALLTISDKCGDDVFFFTAYNDLWKADGTYGVEKYWGIYSS